MKLYKVLLLFDINDHFDIPKQNLIKIQTDTDDPCEKW